MRLIADLAFPETDGTFDILLVAGGPNLPNQVPNPALTEWLSAASRNAVTFGSICTGAFTLGHARLLDGRRVTTHWQNASRLAEMFPAAQVEPDSIYVRDGRLVTSAGVTAGIDLALALVRETHGNDVVLAVAKRLVVVAQRQGGQSQFSPFLMAPTDPASPIAIIQRHVMEHLRERHTLDTLAQLVGMSTRSLARHFVHATGCTPHDFVERARVDAARNLLEGSDFQLKAIAYDCGFARPIECGPSSCSGSPSPRLSIARASVGQAEATRKTKPITSQMGPELRRRSASSRSRRQASPRFF